MRVIDRKKMTEEIISRVKSMPTGVDWRIIRIRRQFDRKDDEQCPELDQSPRMAMSL